MTPSTTAIPDDLSPHEEHWLVWLDKLSTADLKRIAQRVAREKRVGALLVESYYLAKSKPPYFLHLSPIEEDYCTGSARNLPGLSETRLQADRTNRRIEFTTPEGPTHSPSAGAPFKS